MESINKQQATCLLHNINNAQEVWATLQAEFAPRVPPDIREISLEVTDALAAFNTKVDTFIKSDDSELDISDDDVKIMHVIADCLIGPLSGKIKQRSKFMGLPPIR